VPSGPAAGRGRALAQAATAGLLWLWLAGVARAASPCIPSSTPTPAATATVPVEATAGEALLDDRDSIAHVARLIAERLAWMPAVAAWKWQHRVAIADPARERVVVEHAAERARAMGLEPGAARQLFDWQIAAARSLEAACEAQWQHGGFNYPGPVPDLAAVIRPALDRLTEAQLRALYVAVPALDHGAATTDAALSGALPGLPGASREVLGRILAAARFLAPAKLARSRAAGVLRIGTTGDYAPFSSVRQRHLSGVDIELARALARGLGLEPVFVRTSWPSLLADLGGDRFDLAMSGIADTPARRAAGTVSIGYLSGGKTILARCADARRWATLADLDHAGVRVIVNPGGTNEQFVRAALRHAQIRIYPDNTTIFEEIRSGRADAMITDDFEAELQHRRHPELCRTFAGVLTRAEKVALLAPDPALRAAVNDWLRSALESGLPARLLQQAFAEP